jgi:repressor LexA
MMIPGSDQRRRRSRRNPESISLRQREMLEFIERYSQAHQYAPSIRDIRDALGISSTSLVAYHLDVLEARGLLRRGERTSRGLSVVTTTPAIHAPQVRWLGTLTAGTPLPDPEDTSHSDATVSVPGDLFPAERLQSVYALTVRGNSMIDALVADGDTVLVRYQQTADRGDIIVARLRHENAYTLKRYEPEAGGAVRLQPANTTMKPIITTAENLDIQGVMVGVLRRTG